MSFDPSPKIVALQQALQAFMVEHIYPNEQRHVAEAESLGPWQVLDRKSTRLNSSHLRLSRMPSSA